jgi:hypothetical protein
MTLSRVFVTERQEPLNTDNSHVNVVKIITSTMDVGTIRILVRLHIIKVHNIVILSGRPK